MAKKIIAVISLFLSSLVLLIAVVNIVAEISALSLQGSYQITTEGEFDNILDDFHAIQNFGQQQNSELKELEGDVLLRHAALQREAGSAKKALAAYRIAINVEPANANLWTKFAFTKSFLGEFDDEFYFAFNNAIQYGGWEVEVNQNVFNIGMTNLATIKPEALLAVKEAARRLYQINRRELLQNARSHDQLHMVCLWLSDLITTSTICQNEL